MELKHVWFYACRYESFLFESHLYGIETVVVEDIQVGQRLV